MRGQNPYQRGGQPRAPYDMPRWGRPPPGARLGRGRGDFYGVDQSGYDYDARLHELSPEEEDAYLHSDPRGPYGMEDRFQSDELLFDGVDVDSQNYTGHGRSGHYYEDPEYSDMEHYYREERDYPTHRRDSRSSMIIEKEEDLVASAKGKIARARALGKDDVKLSQAEIDALERYERSRSQTKTVPISKVVPTEKKTATKKAIEASKSKRSDSPKARKVGGRVRNASNASSRSARDDEVNYPIPSDSEYSHAGRVAHAELRNSYQGSPLRPVGSRSNSYSNIRNMPGVPPLYAPYYQNQRIVSHSEVPHHSRTASRHRDRADSGRSDYSSRSRSNSHLRTVPIDHLPNPSHTGRVPRFDPADPRFASPRRRVVSGPPYGAPISRRQSDEMFLGVPHDPEVMHYRVSEPPSPSTSGSEGSLYEPPVTVEVTEKHGSKSGSFVKTRSAAANSSAKSTSKSNTKAAVRRR